MFRFAKCRHKNVKQKQPSTTSLPWERTDEQVLPYTHIEFDYIVLIKRQFLRRVLKRFCCLSFAYQLNPYTYNQLCHWTQNHALLQYPDKSHDVTHNKQPSATMTNLAKQLRRRHHYWTSGVKLMCSLLKVIRSTWGSACNKEFCKEHSKLLFTSMIVALSWGIERTQPLSQKALQTQMLGKKRSQPQREAICLLNGLFSQAM